MEPETRHPIGSGAIGGLLLIAAGAIFLLDRNGIIDAGDILHYWPLALFALGVVKLIEPSGSRVFALLLTVAGGVLSLDAFGLIHFRIKTMWPVLLIVLGIALLWRSIEGRGYRGRRPGMAFLSGPGGGQATSITRLNEWAVFGGGDRQIVTKEFEGGELLAIFGSWNVDLTRADIKAKEAFIEANCIFGGVTLRIPDAWEVQMRAGGVFGGTDDKTRHPRGDELASAKRLVVTGTAIFGAIEVKN